MNYIRNSQFQLRNVAGDYILVARGPEAIDFGSVILFNETGVFLWNHLEQKTDLETLSGLLAGEYGISEEIASKDVSAFLRSMLQEGLIRQEED